MIQAENLTKRYGLHTAIENVSFEVGKGEILGFLGPNGAGKTTTMRILAGFLPPTSGRASVAGFDLDEKPLEAKRRIGYLPENPPLYREMTVDSYLRFVGKIKGIPSSSLDSRVAYAKERCSLNDHGSRLIRQLSKGYRQRVGLAQALIHDPDVLILDEPTSGLDPKQIIEVRDLIKSLAGDHTVILSTHILPEVSMTCERVIIISAGRIVAVDTPENLTDQLSGGRRLELEVAGPVDPVEAGISQLAGVKKLHREELAEARTRFELELEPGVEVRPQVARIVVQSGCELYSLQVQSVSLEEVFLKLITQEEAA